MNYGASYGAPPPAYVPSPYGPQPYGAQPYPPRPYVSYNRPYYPPQGPVMQQVIPPTAPVTVAYVTTAPPAYGGYTAPGGYYEGAPPSYSSGYGYRW